MAVTQISLVSNGDASRPLAPGLSTIAIIELRFLFDGICPMGVLNKN